MKAVMPSKTKTPCPQKRNHTTWVKGDPRCVAAGTRSWEIASPAEKARRIVVLRDHDGDPSRSRGGRKGAQATHVYLLSLPPPDQREQYLRIIAAELEAKARKEGKPPPKIWVEYMPRPIVRPPGMPPAKRNKWRDRKRAEAAERERAEAEARAKETEP
jgi:hypothetical protein